MLKVKIYSLVWKDRCGTLFECIIDSEKRQTGVGYKRARYD